MQSSGSQQESFCTPGAIWHLWSFGVLIVPAVGLGAADPAVGVGQGRRWAPESALGGHHSAGRADIGESWFREQSRPMGSLDASLIYGGP